MLRTLARPMLSTIFVLGGVGQLRDIQGHTQGAKPWLDKTVGKQAASLPESVPTDPETLVRIDGIVKVAGGLALATGKFQRLASLALLQSLTWTTLAAHSFWEYEDESQRQQQQIQFAKNASLAGGLVMAATDPKGRPELGWSARKAAKKASKQVQGTGEQAQVRGEELSKKAQKRSDELSKKAQKRGEELSKKAQKRSEELNKKAQKRRGELSSKAQQRGEQLSKKTQKRSGDANRKACKTGQPS